MLGLSGLELSPGPSHINTGAHRGVFKVVKAVVSQNEPASLPGLYPATCRAKRDALGQQTPRQAQATPHTQLSSWGGEKGPGRV